MIVILIVNFIRYIYFLDGFPFFLDFDGDLDSDSDSTDDSEDEPEESEDELDEPEDEDEPELVSDEEDEELDESEDVEFEPDFDLERFDLGLVIFSGAKVGGALFMRVTTDATDFLIGVSSDMYESSVLDFFCSEDDCLPFFLVSLSVRFLLSLFGELLLEHLLSCLRGEHTLLAGLLCGLAFLCGLLIDGLVLAELALLCGLAFLCGLLFGGLAFLEGIDVTLSTGLTDRDLLCLLVGLVKRFTFFCVL